MDDQGLDRKASKGSTRSSDGESKSTKMQKDHVVTFILP